MACSSCYDCGSPCTTCGGYTPPPPPPPYVCPDPQPCDVAMDAECVLYTGDDLTCIGVTPPKSVSSILVSLDQLLCQLGAGVTYVTSTNCIDLDGDGTQANPITATPRLDASASNLIKCQSTGLSAFLNVDDSDCVSLSGAGTTANPLVADVIIDPRPSNLLSCGVDGLLVTGSTISIADSNCIDLSGNGSAGSPLTASPIISTTAGNILSCTANGLLSKLNVNTVAGCVALSGDGTSGSPLAVSLTTNSTLQCISGTLGVNPNFVTADNGLTKTGANIQLGGSLIKNTNVSLAGFTLTLKDNGSAPTGIEIIPGISAPTDFTTNVNRISGKNYINGLTHIDSNLGIGVAPLDSTLNPETPRLRVVKSITNGTSISSVASTFNLTLPSTVSTLSSGNIYASNSSILYYRAGTNITVPGTQDKFVTGSFHQFVLEAAGAAGNITSNGKVSALAARGYFVYGRNIDSFSAIRIANSVPDASGYTGTVSELIGLKIDDQRLDTNLTITKSYAIKQLGENDENRYYGPTYHINNVGIGTAPVTGTNIYGNSDSYPNGTRLNVYSGSYTLPNTGQSSVTSTSINMKMATATSGSPYNVGRVVSSITTLEVGFAGTSSSAGTQNLDLGGGGGCNWASAFSYLRFTTPRAVSASSTILSSNAAQSNFVSNTVLLTNCTSIGTIVTCDSTAGLTPGAKLIITGGTGTLAAGTTVASVTNATTFTLSAIPSVALSNGASLKARLAGNLTGTIATYRAMSPIADVENGYYGTVTNAIGILVEQQSLIQGNTDLGSGSITNTYGIVQGSISDATKGQGDINIFNAEKNLFKNLPVYANDAAAVSLAAGTLYRTPTGEVRVKL